MMKITAITTQVKNPNRVSVSVDGKYRFSLDIAQLVDMGLKQGQDIDEASLAEYEQESAFGKLYARTLEYCLMRPHSAKEVRDYLWRKTLSRKVKHKASGEVRDQPGVSTGLTERVFRRLEEKGYINDESFARWWVDNRSLSKGVSRRKLTQELRGKGVELGIIDAALSSTDRDETTELTKVVEKKRSKYPDQQKLIQYLMRQGFRYDDILLAIQEDA